ncbi:MAG: RNA-binding transcriptional accessory protein [Defluviitaleaceae bacterium]|nr:RNA-binding transcriptional accessory protein [Defluviitaleaceae bacterium]
MEASYVDSLYKQIEKNLNVKSKQIESVLTLLKEGSTVPFIARYRKEATGGLDEDQIREISKAYEYGVNLEERKLDVIRLISEKGMMTPELEAAIKVAGKLTEVEDLYRPFKEKKKTRATEAKRKGLEPLAMFLLEYGNDDVEAKAGEFLSEEVETAEMALSGAMDIVAEVVADDPAFRKLVRGQIMKSGKLSAQVKDESLDEKGVYKQYYDYESVISKVANHQVLAMNRAESAKVIRVGIVEDADFITGRIKAKFIQKEGSTTGQYVALAIEDGYKRLIKPSIEREIRAELKEKAETGAIHIFSENLRQLLLQPPMKDRVVLGVDPAFRTGCKLAVVSPTGAVLAIDVIYPHEASKGAKPNPTKVADAKKKVTALIEKHGVEIVSIGNGTASRETEAFVADVLRDIDKDVKYVITNEAGASVYSAGRVAQKEFPDFAVEERSAVSIARRLQDPLAELVKIDPKSIGVGQYQHDVNGKALDESLNFVVETAVNRVGVNLNTASPSLLTHVAGMNGTIADNVVAYRDEIGRFTNRKQLQKVKRLGVKTYEQAVGFLRIPNGENPLDMTPIHPESYDLAQKVMENLGVTVADLGSEAMKLAVDQADGKKLAAILGADIFTVQDVLAALVSPNRDLRDELDAPLLRRDVLKLEDITLGMELEGTVRNIVDFGAFVDCGLKNDGLVHLSQMKKGFVKHPMDVVSVGDVVTVWVKEVDQSRGRLGLTMIAPA